VYVKANPHDKFVIVGHVDDKVEAVTLFRGADGDGGLE